MPAPSIKMKHLAKTTSILILGAMFLHERSVHAQQAVTLDEISVVNSTVPGGGAGPSNAPGAEFSYPSTSPASAAAPSTGFAYSAPAYDSSPTAISGAGAGGQNFGPGTSARVLAAVNQAAVNTPAVQSNGVPSMYTQLAALNGGPSVASVMAAEAARAATPTPAYNPTPPAVSNNVGAANFGLTGATQAAVTPYGFSNSATNGFSAGAATSALMSSALNGAYNVYAPGGNPWAPAHTAMYSGQLGNIQVNVNGPWSTLTQNEINAIARATKISNTMFGENNSGNGRGVNLPQGARIDIYADNYDTAALGYTNTKTNVTTLPSDFNDATGYHELGHQVYNQVVATRPLYKSLNEILYKGALAKGMYMADYNTYITKTPEEYFAEATGIHFGTVDNDVSMRGAVQTPADMQLADSGLVGFLTALYGPPVMQQSDQGGGQ